MGRPWLLGRLAHYLATGERLADPSMFERGYIIRRHFDDILNHFGTYKGIRIARKHLAWYSQDCKGSLDFRRKINAIDDPNQVVTEINSFFCDNFDLVRDNIIHEIGQRTNSNLILIWFSVRTLFAVLAVDLELNIRFLNTAAGIFVRSGGMDGRQLGEFVAPHSPLVAQASKRQTSAAEYMYLSLRNGPTEMAITALMGEIPDITVVSLHEQSIARQISNQIAHRNAARSVNG